MGKLQYPAHRITIGGRYPDLLALRDGDYVVAGVVCGDEDDLLAGLGRAVERLGSPPDFLAYPRGRYADRHMRLAREAGYTGACSVILGWGDLGRSGRYDLRRMTIKGTESLLRFRLRLGLCRLVRYAGAEP